MTTTQVQYWNYVESNRHNLATERLGTDTLKESVRHNKATETLGTNTLKETTRHNKATERLGTNTLKENKRHNIATEKETKRSNKRRESIQYGQLREQVRSNKAREDISREANAINAARTEIERTKANASVSKMNAEVNKLKKEFENMDLYTIMRSKNKVASSIAATALFADVLADPHQSKATKAAINKFKNFLINDTGKGAFQKNAKWTFKTGDGRDIKLQYVGGNWIFAPVK